MQKKYPQMPSNDEFHGVSELARMQLEMQRELTALRAEKLILTQRRTGPNEQALSSEVKRLGDALSQARREIEMYRHHHDTLSATLNEVYASWSWRIGQRVVSLVNVIRHPLKRFKDSK